MFILLLFESYFEVWASATELWFCQRILWNKNFEIFNSIERSYRNSWPLTASLFCPIIKNMPFCRDTHGDVATSDSIENATQDGAWRRCKNGLVLRHCMRACACVSGFITCFRITRSERSRFSSWIRDLFRYFRSLTLQLWRGKRRRRMATPSEMTQPLSGEAATHDETFGGVFSDAALAAYLREGCGALLWKKADETSCRWRHRRGKRWR